MFSNRAIAFAPVQVGGSDYAGLTPNKYVRSSGTGGSDSNNGNTEITAYATLAFAMGQISAGQIVGVVNALTESINIGTLSGGSVGSFKRAVTKTDGTTITGTFGSGSGSNKYISFEGLHWLHGTTEHDCESAPQLKFIRCGFQGGPTSGNTVTHLAGSDQLYESCYFLTPGGRYASLSFQQANLLYRWCIFRTDNWGSPADDGNPSAPLQMYSNTSQVGAIQCVVLDCVNQRSLNEWLGNYSVTTNVGTGVGLHQECFGVKGPSGEIGMQVEGSSGATYSGLGNISCFNGWGFVENLDSGTGSITIDGGEYSSNANSGMARFGVESYTPINVNTTNNSGGNFNGVSAGSGCTTNALNMTSIVDNMIKRGLSGTMYGETGWNVQQGSEKMFPLPIESVAKTKYNGFKTARGWTATTDIATYLKGLT